MKDANFIDRLFADIWLWDEIRNDFPLEEKFFKKSYLVAQFRDASQFDVAEVTMSFVRLLDDPRIFVGGKDKEDVFRWHKELQQLQQDRLESLKAMVATRDKKQRILLADQLKRLDDEISESRARIADRILDLDLGAFAVEVRFSTLRIEAILTLKEHPTVKKVGRTDPHRLNIRVVLDVSDEPAVHYPYRPRRVASVEHALPS